MTFTRRAFQQLTPDSAFQSWKTTKNRLRVVGKFSVSGRVKQYRSSAVIQFGSPHEWILIKFDRQTSYVLLAESTMFQCAVQHLWPCAKFAILRISFVHVVEFARFVYLKRVLVISLNVPSTILSDFLLILIIFFYWKEFNKVEKITWNYIANIHFVLFLFLNMSLIIFQMHKKHSLEFMLKTKIKYHGKSNVEICVLRTSTSAECLHKFL